MTEHRSELDRIRKDRPSLLSSVKVIVLIATGVLLAWSAIHITISWRPKWRYPFRAAIASTLLAMSLFCAIAAYNQVVRWINWRHAKGSTIEKQ
jgi:hypothetical protein